MRGRAAALLVAGAILALVACDGPLGPLLGGGPKVAANIQAGKTNTQTLGTTTVTEQKLVRPQARTIEQSSGTTGVKAEQVQQVVVNETPLWLIAAAMLLAGFVIPSPAEIARGIRGLFRRGKKGVQP